MPGGGILGSLGRVPARERRRQDEVRRLTESALTGAADLKVPLTISVATGPSWAAAKG